MDEEGGFRVGVGEGRTGGRVGAVGGNIAQKPQKSSSRGSSPKKVFTPKKSLKVPPCLG